MNQIAAIETRYAGCRFRSRLEARWAVFFDTLGISWEYEPQGFELSTGRYLPDFLLPECGTWVEVKGSEQRLNVHRLTSAAVELPSVSALPGCEQGPALMILGPIPPPLRSGDYGWVGLSPMPGEPTSSPLAGRYGFGTFAKNRRPWWHDVAADGGWLAPTVDRLERSAGGAYTAARSARFEHGETG